MEIAVRRCGVFAVDENAALAELELAWADGGYHGFRNHASLRAAAVDDGNLVPHVGGGCGSGAGWGFVVVRRRRAGRKVDSGGGVPPVVTVRTWTVRGRVSD
jgi:hypothetical protein